MDANNGCSQGESHQQDKALENERQEWARLMRLRFTPKEMLNEDGSINFEYVLGRFGLNPVVWLGLALIPADCDQVFQTQKRECETTQSPGQEVGRKRKGAVGAGHSEVWHRFLGSHQKRAFATVGMRSLPFWNTTASLTFFYSQGSNGAANQDCSANGTPESGAVH